MSEYLLTSEVARLLELSNDTVRHYERTGRLPANRTDGGVRLFSREVVEAFAAARAKRGRKGWDQRCRGENR
jgi:excisionase family DNA binding protein